MKQPSVLTSGMKDANRAQRIYMQTVAAHRFFTNFIAEIYGYSVMYVGLSIADGVVPEMLLDDANVTVEHPETGHPMSLSQLHRILRNAGTVFGPELPIAPVSMDDPLFEAQRSAMAQAWGTPIDFCNRYVNAVARGIDVRFPVSDATRDAVILSGACGAYQYLSNMLPAFVDHYGSAAEFVDTFVGHANDPTLKTREWSWPVTFNHALLSTLFVDAEFGSGMELYRMYSNLVNNAQHDGAAATDDVTLNALVYMALGNAV